MVGTESVELLTTVITSASVVTLTVARTLAAVRRQRIRARAQCEIVRLLQPGSRFTDINGETVIVEVGGAMTIERAHP